MSRPPLPEPPEYMLGKRYRPVPPPPPPNGPSLPKPPPRVFNLFAYHHGDSGGEHDERRDHVPDWRVPSAVGWALARGFDSVLIELVDGNPSSTRSCTHHVCADSRCPGGCD